MRRSTRQLSSAKNNSSSETNDQDRSDSNSTNLRNNKQDSSKEIDLKKKLIEEIIVLDQKYENKIFVYCLLSNEIDNEKRNKKIDEQKLKEIHESNLYALKIKLSKLTGVQAIKYTDEEIRFNIFVNEKNELPYTYFIYFDITNSNVKISQYDLPYSFNKSKILERYPLDSVDKLYDIVSIAREISVCYHDRLSQLKEFKKHQIFLSNAMQMYYPICLTRVELEFKLCGNQRTNKGQNYLIKLRLEYGDHKIKPFVILSSSELDDEEKLDLENIFQKFLNEYRLAIAFELIFSQIENKFVIINYYKITDQVLTNKHSSSKTLNNSKLDVQITDISDDNSETIQTENEDNAEEVIRIPRKKMTLLNQKTSRVKKSNKKIDNENKIIRDTRNQKNKEEIEELRTRNQKAQKLKEIQTQKSQVLTNNELQTRGQKVEKLQIQNKPQKRNAVENFVEIKKKKFKNDELLKNSKIQIRSPHKINTLLNIITSTPNKNTNHLETKNSKQNIKHSDFFPTTSSSSPSSISKNETQKKSKPNLIKNFLRTKFEQKVEKASPDQKSKPGLKNKQQNNKMSQKNATKKNKMLSKSITPQKSKEIKTPIKNRTKTPPKSPSHSKAVSRLFSESKSSLNKSTPKRLNNENSRNSSRRRLDFSSLENKSKQSPSPKVQMNKRGKSKINEKNLAQIKTSVKNVRTPVKNVRTPIKNVRTPIKNVRTPVKNVKTPVKKNQKPVKNLKKSPRSQIQRKKIIYKKHNLK